MSEQSAPEKVSPRISLSTFEPRDLATWKYAIMGHTNTHTHRLTPLVFHPVSSTLSTGCSGRPFLTSSWQYSSNLVISSR